MTKTYDAVEAAKAQERYCDEHEIPEQWLVLQLRQEHL